MNATSQRRIKFEDYDGFVEKFKPKKTTDDCYTPPEVYEVIRDWACAEYGIDPAKVVRPFYPGGDYERFDYSDGAVVLDNPPFSILSKIVSFYLDNDVPFFLFCPSLTAFASARVCMRCCHVICDCNIEYENGAVVRTSFITSYDDGTIARTAPDLTSLVGEKVAELRQRKATQFPKYEYPDNIVTAAMMQRWAKYGVEFRVSADECLRVSGIDASPKGIYGGGLLLSDAKASERAAAERAAAERAHDRELELSKRRRAHTHVWELSDREREMVRMLGER